MTELCNLPKAGPALLLGLLALAAPAAAVNWMWSAPSWAVEAFERAGIELPGATGTSRFVASTYVNPYVVSGDFDGDRRTDIAALVRERASGKVGVAIALQSGAVHVVGAGSALGNGGDNFDWLDHWYTFTRGPVSRGASGDPAPTLRGDAIWVEKSESASALIYWSGNGFAWYQQGD
jgi:hypothetical protein